MITGPEMQAWGRLVIDPYSGMIYSSSPEVYGRINELKQQGYELTSIIGHLLDGSHLVMEDNGQDVSAAYSSSMVDDPAPELVQ
ncbi:MAG: hypothetical protein HC843_04515 [Sphingomonadales bacterium]|nr:hypothetical protein [Sphingomonadales bacterium]